MSNLPPLPLVDGCLFIDNSLWMEGLMTCSRALQYKALSKRILSNEKPSLNFGSAIHLALEYRYSVYGNRPVDNAYYNTIAEIFTEWFTEHPTPDGDWRTINWAMTLVRKYNERWELEGFNLLRHETPIECPQCNGRGEILFEHGESIPETPPNTLPCVWCSGTGKREAVVELPFSLPLYTHFPSVSHDPNKFFVGEPIPVIYCGRIDLPTSENSELIITDHKTCSQMGSMFWDTQRMAAQQRGYCWAFEQVMKTKVRKYRINAIRSKEPPLYVTNPEGKRKGTLTPEQWWQESFQREVFPVKDGELDAWKNNTIELLEEFFWHYSRGYLPQKTTWCSSYGRCQYYEVCQLHQDDREGFLKSGVFTENSWSPLNKIKTK